MLGIISSMAPIYAARNSPTIFWETIMAYCSGIFGSALTTSEMMRAELRLPGVMASLI